MARIHIPRFVITGGPCGGKTSVLAYLARYFTDKGFRVFIVPEAATILIGMGMSPVQKDFQEQIVKLIIFLENNAYQSALAAQKVGQKPIIICDRGTLDGRAYMPTSAFEKLLKKIDISIISLRDERYTGVFHLVTAADGAESFYTLENNAARSENPEQARILDIKTQNAWVGHSHLSVVDNTTDFEEKKKRVSDAICHALGIPVPLEIEYKYLIDPAFSEKDIPSSIHRVTLDVTQYYLISAKTEWEERVRKRAEGKYALYTHTLKRPTPDKKGRFEIERIVSRDEYVDLLERQDPDYYPLRKTRTCFLYSKQYFEFDTLLNVRKGLKYCENEVSDMQTTPVLPDWLPVLADVTGDTAHSMKTLARKI